MSVCGGSRRHRHSRRIADVLDDLGWYCGQSSRSSRHTGVPDPEDRLRHGRAFELIQGSGPWIRHAEVGRKLDVSFEHQHETQRLVVGTKGLVGRRGIEAQPPAYWPAPPSFVPIGPSPRQGRGHSHVGGLRGDGGSRRLGAAIPRT